MQVYISWYKTAQKRTHKPKKPLNEFPPLQIHAQPWGTTTRAHRKDSAWAA